MIAYISFAMDLICYFLEYLDERVEATINNCETCISQDDIGVPQPLCSQYERPEKVFAVEQHRSRFNL